MRITASKLREQGHQVWYPQFPSPDTPNPNEWQELLRQESNMMDEIPRGEKIAIAHSLGTINWLYGAASNRFTKPFDRVLLVAVPDPVMTIQAEGISGAPFDFMQEGLSEVVSNWAVSCKAVASDNDKWQPNGISFYENLRVPTTVIQGAGHFSLDDGWGRWPGLEKWVLSGKSEDLTLRTL